VPALVHPDCVVAVHTNVVLLQQAPTQTVALQVAVELHMPLQSPRSIIEHAPALLQQRPIWQGFGEHGPPKKSPPALSQAESVRGVQAPPMQQAPVWATAVRTDTRMAIKANNRRIRVAVRDTGATKEALLILNQATKQCKERKKTRRESPPGSM